MTRGVCLSLVGSIVLVSLSGCGHGFFTEERAPWRAEAEIACLKSGAVKEGPDIVRIDPIDGPGICGAEFPLKVSALGDAPGAYGFADEDLRPPAPIGNQPRWPIAQPPASYPQGQAYPQNGNYQPAAREPAYGAPANGPISLTAPGVAPDQGQINLPPEGAPEMRGGVVGSPYRQSGAENDPPQNYTPAQAAPYPPREAYRAPYPPRPDAAPAPLPPLGPPSGNAIEAAGPVAVKPAATLACPIVSVLQRWLAQSVQPAAMRWFGSRVVEIKQISAYSCRGMNGNPNAHISEHAFGNALDIAAFTLADGRRISVEHGWHGLPEEQGFLRDVQAAACSDFNTVLAPGANVYHYNHIHVDLMRRARRPYICEPAAVSGEEVAARAQQRYPYASRETSVTGSIRGSKQAARHRGKAEHDDEDEDD
jgi:hypothetical protein